MSIQVKNLTHIYGKGMPFEQVALDDVSFEAEDGQFVGIIGHTGSGKSTLLQHLNGLLSPDSGSVIVDGVDITKPGVSMRDIRKNIGLVFQYPEYQLFEDTVGKDVAYGPLNLGLTQEEANVRVDEALKLVGLDPEKIRDKSPFELSGGQKRRVAIAGVIAMKPRVLIMDEPTAGLDPKAHRELLEMIVRIHRSQNNILILVSHNMADIARLSDKVIVMDSGRAVMEGSPKEIFSRYKELYDIGLNVPPATELLFKLSAKGFDVDTQALTNDEVAAEIARLLKARQAGNPKIANEEDER